MVLNCVKAYVLACLFFFEIMQFHTGVHELFPDLWIWRARHPFWKKEDDYQEVVTSTYVESGGERILIDPLAPALDCIGLWERLEKMPPTMVVVTMPDHVRDIDMFVSRFGAKSYGPMFFFPDQVPNTELVPVIAGSELPGGLIPLYDARGRAETPIYLPSQRTIVFGDALTERNGELRVWASPWHKSKELPALKEMLDLPFERVIISHCDNSPVHSRADFEHALILEPFR